MIRHAISPRLAIKSVFTAGGPLGCPLRRSTLQERRKTFEPLGRSPPRCDSPRQILKHRLVDPAPGDIDNQFLGGNARLGAGGKQLADDPIAASTERRFVGNHLVNQSDSLRSDLVE